MRNMKHETVARDLAKRAIKFVQSNKRVQEFSINMGTYYMKLDAREQYLSFGSAETEGEIAACSSQGEFEEFFLGILDRMMSREHLIEYGVQ